jgi:hypothetical protein
MLRRYSVLCEDTLHDEIQIFSPGSALGITTKQHVQTHCQLHDSLRMRHHRRLFTSLA